MALLKSQKKDLAKKYTDSFSKSINMVVLTFDKIPVNQLNQLRIEVADAQGLLQVVKKRILLKALDGNFEGLTLDQAQATVMMLYTYNIEDEHAPLKIIQKYVKKRTKEQTGYVLEYVGGWYEKSRQQAAWVKQLATLPTKEELISKFLFLLNHPVSSLARAFQAIAEAQGLPAPVVEPKIEQTPEPETETATEELSPPSTPTEESVSPSSEETPAESAQD